MYMQSMTRKGIFYNGGAKCQHQQTIKGVDMLNRSKKYGTVISERSPLDLQLLNIEKHWLRV